MNPSSPLTNIPRVVQAIYDKKGFNVLVLDVRHSCTMTDFFIIAEGTVDRHVQALSHAVIDAFAARGEEPLHVEGQQVGDWVVLDYSDIVVHLFIPEWREKYRLESLWHQGILIDLEKGHVANKGADRDA